MKSAIAFIAACALFLVGCSGGGTENFKGEVSGIVFDEEGLPVRDAHVYFDAGSGKTLQTQSNSNGLYVLVDVPTGDQVIRVEVTKSGVRYFGSNVARVDRGARTMNHNVAIYRDDRLANIEGFVQDRYGYKLKGARVFAKQSATNTVLTSNYAITDDEGHYVLGALRANITYDVQVNGLDYNSDFDAFTLAVGERRRMDFILPDAESITLPAPKNVAVTAWTSPDATRDRASADALSNLKRIIKPDWKPVASSRATGTGSLIEIDVTWDAIFDNALLGFGLYRADAGGALRDIYFLRDPLAELFADTDENLQVGRNYVYRVSTLSTNGSESNLSAAGNATPLGGLTLVSTSGGSVPVFRWNFASGAATYVVYLFDQYPSIGVSPIWSNELTPTAGNQLSFTGGSLARGDYYFMVAGTSATGNYSISAVGKHTVL